SLACLSFCSSLWAVFDILSISGRNASTISSISLFTRRSLHSIPLGRRVYRRPRAVVDATLLGPGRTAAGRSRGLLGDPVHRIAIVFESLGIFERVLGRVHHQVRLVVVLGFDLNGIEGNGDIFLAGPEKAANTDDQRAGFALVIHQDIHDLADLVVVRIIDVLLIPVGNRHAAG